MSQRKNALTAAAYRVKWIVMGDKVAGFGSKKTFSPLHLTPIEIFFTAALYYAPVKTPFYCDIVPNQ